jgi:hypothetical protein
MEMYLFVHKDLTGLDKDLATLGILCTREILTVRTMAYRIRYFIIWERRTDVSGIVTSLA